MCWRFIRRDKIFVKSHNSSRNLSKYILKYEFNFSFTNRYVFSKVLFCLYWWMDRTQRAIFCRECKLEFRTCFVQDCCVRKVKNNPWRILCVSGNNSTLQCFSFDTYLLCGVPYSSMGMSNTPVDSLATIWVV